jgi:hypothetical protein
MATIYQKLAASGDNCLILEPKEALLYPFSFDYTYIKMGMFVSYTTLEENNGYSATSETIASANLTTDYKNVFLCGFKDNSPLNPLRSGTFVGASVFKVGANNFLLKQSANNCITNTNTASGLISQTGTYSLFQYNSNWTTNDSLSSNCFPLPTSTLATGSGAYAAFWGLSLKIANKGTTGQSVSLGIAKNSYAAGFSDISNTAMRNLMSDAFTEGSYSPLTSGFVSGAGPLPLPNAVYVYSPFINNRLRIHSVLVEKYA